MRKFKENLTDGQPAIRIGGTVPSDAVNLAFYDAPIISPDETIQIFDRSNLIPENTSVVSIEESNLFSDEEGRLKSSSGVYRFPVSNIVMTNIYYTPGKGLDPVPLYYEYKTRFKHYEEGISQSGTFEYDGYNIKILEGDSETDKAYKILLTKEGDNTYSVTVYSEFISSENSRFYIQYNKYTDNTGSIENDIREFMNSRVIFQEASKEDVQNASGDEKIYHVEKLPSDEGFIFYAPNKANVEMKNPIVFRWRVVRNGSEYGPWSITTLQNKNSLQEVEYLSESGEKIYFEFGDRVEKKLVRPMDHFGQRSGSYSIEVEALNNDSRNIHISPQGPTDGTSVVYVFTHDNTGTANSELNEYSIRYEPQALEFKIRGESIYEESFVIPGRTTNLARIKNGATIQSDVSSQGYVRYGEVDKLIDGNNPAYHPFPGTIPDERTIFSAYTAEERNPPQNNVTITIEFPEEKTVNDFNIVMGRRGSIMSTIMKDSDDQILWSGSLDGPVINRDTRTWRKDLDDPISGVKTVEVVIKPDRWKSKDYSWLSELFGYRDKYTCGFQIYQINVFERIPPDEGNQTLNWVNEVSVQASFVAGSPHQISFSEILSEYPEMVPPEDHKESAVYIVEYDDNDVLESHASIKLINERTGEYNTGLEISYSEIEEDPYIIETSTDKYVIMSSYLYTAKTKDSNNIYIKEPGFKSFNEMWTLKINNGRIYINDFNNNIAKEYYIPEFGHQAFSPEYPYKTVIDEEAQFIDSRLIKVSNRNLYIETDSQGNITNMSVTRNGVDLKVKDWDIFNGEIYLDENIEFTDDIYVSYVYEEKAYEYKGYADSGHGKFFHLDLNPMPGHTYTYPLDETGEERPSAELLDKTVYIYINPTYVSDNGEIRGEVGSTIRHYIADGNEMENTSLENILLENRDALVLAKIIIRDRNIPTNIITMDSRRRGGGFSDRISQEFIRSLIGEDDSVWDITPWDGHPYPSNGVGIITLPRSILKESGGRFTRGQVREIIEKHIAFGVYAIIRYK